MPSVYVTLPVTTHLSTVVPIPLVTESSNSPVAIAIISMLSVGIFGVIVSIVWLLIKRGERGKFKIMRNPKIKQSDLKRPLSSNYGAVGMSKSNPLSSLQEHNEETVSEDGDIKTDLQDSSIEISLDQKMDEVPSTGEPKKENMQKAAIRRSKFPPFGFIAGGLDISQHQKNKVCCM